MIRVTKHGKAPLLEIALRGNDQETVNVLLDGLKNPRDEDNESLEIAEVVLHWARSASSVSDIQRNTRRDQTLSFLRNYLKATPSHPVASLLHARWLLGQDLQLNGDLEGALATLVMNPTVPSLSGTDEAEFRAVTKLRRLILEKIEQVEQRGK